jgi:predicted component of type VI protein secretion system
MAKLILQFEGQTLKEVAIGAHPVTIGRGPDNDIHIDNLAISTHHAKVYQDAGRVIIEDLNSLNGTFMNNQRITKSFLKIGDKVLIGKHHLMIDDTVDGEAPAAAAPKVAAPKISETVVLDTKARKELLAAALAAQAAGQPIPEPRAGGTMMSQPAAAARTKVAHLTVIDGKTDQRDYALTGKLIIIGKSEMATIKLRGWFKPKMAAQITKKDDGCYIGTAEKTPKVNGMPISGPTKLNDGDIIEVAGVKMSFAMRDA